MAALTDEMLMVYADGLLEGEMRERVESLINSNPEYFRRVEIFRATGQSLSQHFRQPMIEPVPSHLVDLVLHHGNEGFTRVHKTGAVPARWRRLKKIFGAWSQKLTAQAMTWQMSWQGAAVAAVLLAVAGGTGWMLRGAIETPRPGGSDVVAFERGQILAQGVLQYVLETKPSMEVVRLPGGIQDSAVVRANLSFKTKQGGFCREYSIETSSEGEFSGLACRAGAGKWVLQVHVTAAAAPRDTKSHPVARLGDAALEPIVTGLMDGDVFGPKEEKTAIASGWK